VPANLWPDDAGVRSHYAVAFYLIIFPYIVVAAYKMGMVHEKPRVVTRHDLVDGAAAPTEAAEIEPGSVIELRDDTNTPAAPPAA
jgi:hypothetical protein